MNLLRYLILISLIVIPLHAQNLYQDARDYSIYGNRHEFYIGPGIGILPIHYSFTTGYLYFNVNNYYEDWNSTTVLPIYTTRSSGYGLTLRYEYYTTGIFGIGGQLQEGYPDKYMSSELIEYINETYGTERYKDSISTNFNYISLSYTSDGGILRRFDTGIGYYSYTNEKLYMNQYTGKSNTYRGCYILFNYHHPFYINTESITDRIIITLDTNVILPLSYRDFNIAAQISFGVSLYYSKNTFF